MAAIRKSGTVLPLGHKPPGFRGARLRSHGGGLTTRGKAYVAAKVKGGGTPSRASVAAGRHAVVPLGVRDAVTSATAEAHVAGIMAAQHKALGTAVGLFGTRNSDSGKPPYAPGMHGTPIVQPFQSPYKARFTYGAPRF